MAIVTANNLVKVYDHKQVAVDNISFEIEEGKVFGFLGPNGAGKSTTIKMLIGLLQPTSGSVTLGESNGDKTQIHEVLGYIPQDLVFFEHLSAKENADLFATTYNISHASKRIEEVFQLLGLIDIQDQLANTLSGGQKRRLNVALGLLHSPKILVMDEPSAGMDPQSRNILWETIQNLSQQNMTIILTTHLMEVVEKLADDICIIDHGKILASGSIRQLKRKYGAGEMIDITIKEDQSPQTIEKIRNLCNQEFGSDKIFYKDNQLSIPTEVGVLGIQKVMEILQPLGLDIIDQITARHHSLEDIFISLTGRELRE